MSQLIISMLLCTTNASDQSILSQITRDRMKMISCEIIVKVRSLQDDGKPVVPELDEFHYWWTSDLSIYRMDRHLIGKKNREDSDHHDNVSFDGLKLRIIGRKDSPDYPLTELSIPKYYTQRKIDLFDPRLIGLFIETIKIYHNYKFINLEEIYKNSIKFDNGIGKSGKYEIFTSAIQNQNKYYQKYVYNDKNLPVYAKYWSDADENVSVEARFEYGPANLQKLWMPKKIDLKRYINDHLSIHEIWEIEVISINKKIDRAICQWSELKPTPGSRLVVDYDAKKIENFWDGRQFQRIPNGEFDYKKYMIAQSRKKTKLYIALLLSILSAVLIAYRILKRKSNNGK